MRRESANPLSGGGRKRPILFWLFFPPLFWALPVLLGGWSYCSHELLGLLTGEKLWMRFSLWLGSCFTTPLCPLKSFLIWLPNNLFPLVMADLFLSLITMSSYFSLGNWHQVEHGSAHWATARELKVFRKNEGMPIGEGLYITKKAALGNGNLFLQGPPGSGKSFGIIIPGIEAQSRPGKAQASFLATDVKGALYRDTVKMVRDRGMTTYLLNLSDPWYSNCYSPLDNVHEERKNVEIAALALAFAKNVRDEEAGVGDSIWEDTFTALLRCVWFYQYDFRINPLNNKPESRGLWRSGELIRGITLDPKSGMISDDCELSRLMNAVRCADPLHPALSDYEFIMTKAMRETIASVLFTAGSKVSLFGYPEIQALTMQNEIPMDEICEKPTAIYLNYQIGSPFRVLAALFIEQLFAAAYYVAETRHAGRLPLNLKMFLDELPSICRVYTLPARASTVRSYNIDLFVSCQSRQQLEAVFKNQDKTLINNCAVQIYLGSSEQKVLKDISDALGETTTTEINHSYGARGGSSDSTRLTGRKLALPSELLTMPKRYEVVIIPSHPPIYCEKHRTERRRWYKLLGGAGNPKNNRVIEEDLYPLSQLHRAEFEELRKKRLQERGEGL